MGVQKRRKEERNQPARFSLGTIWVEKTYLFLGGAGAFGCAGVYVLFVAKVMPASNTPLKKEIAAKAYGTW